LSCACHHLAVEGDFLFFLPRFIALYPPCKRSARDLFSGCSGPGHERQDECNSSSLLLLYCTVLTVLYFLVMMLYLSQQHIIVMCISMLQRRPKMDSSSSFAALIIILLNENERELSTVIVIDLFPVSTPSHPKAWHLHLLITFLLHGPPVRWYGGLLRGCISHHPLPAPSIFADTKHASSG
jgi:hypothetical protein